MQDQQRCSSNSISSRCQRQEQARTMAKVAAKLSIGASTANEKTVKDVHLGLTIK
jgi:hypothetical protein